MHVDLDALTLAGAFILGALAGTGMTLVVLRIAARVVMRSVESTPGGYPNEGQ